MVVKPERGPAASKKPGQESCVRSSGIITCQHDGLVTVQDKARLRQGHNDQSHWGQQCSETTLTGEYRFHIRTPLGIEPGSLIMGSKRVDHWTSRTVYECSKIAGSPQYDLPTVIYNYFQCTDIMKAKLKSEEYLHS